MPDYHLEYSWQFSGNHQPMASTLQTEADFWQREARTRTANLVRDTPSSEVLYVGLYL